MSASTEEPRSDAPPSALVPPRRVINITLTVLLVLAGFIIVISFQDVVFSVLSAIILGVSLRPTIDWLVRRGVNRSLAAALIMIALLAVFIVVSLLFIPLISEQGAGIAATVGDYYEWLINELRDSPSYFLRRLGGQFPMTLEAIVRTSAPAPPGGPAAPAQEDVDATDVLLGQVDNLLSGVSLVLRGLLVTLAVLLLTYYWTQEGDRATRQFLMLFPVDRRENLREFIALVETKLGAYLRGLIILSIVIGTVSTLVYTLIGLPQALLLGLMAGVFEAIPLVGPVIGAVPALLLALAIEPSKVPWVVLAVVVIQQLESSLLVPRVMKQAVGVNPFASLLALAAFGSLFGVGGALLAIPLVAIAQLALNRYVFTPAARVQYPGRDAVTILRYETGELVKDLRRLDLGQGEGEGEMLVEDELEAIAVDLDSLLAQMEKSEKGDEG